MGIKVLIDPSVACFLEEWHGICGGRSINRHILVLIRKDIEQYEKEHGKIGG